MKTKITISMVTIMGLHMIMRAGESSEGHNLSHAERNLSVEAVQSIEKKIRERGDLPYITVSKQIELLQALSEFGLGRFLIERGGLNGYWTDYVIRHPEKGRLTGLNSESRPFTELESFLLDRAPTSLATQQRFAIFKQTIQSLLHEGVALASIPCGLTGDLLDSDFSQIRDFSICGIDIDPESLDGSRKLAENAGLTDHCQFIRQDAWSLEEKEKFDVVMSNGLSIYEPNRERVVDLYRRFFSALKSNGYLVTSFLTPPPVPGMQTEWDLGAVNSDHALLQKILFADILDCKWQIFRSEEEVRSQLSTAGFTEIEIVYDIAHIFPTVIARKL